MPELIADWEEKKGFTEGINAQFESIKVEKTYVGSTLFGQVYIANSGKARGCCTNTVLTDPFADSSFVKISLWRRQA